MSSDESVESSDESSGSSGSSESSSESSESSDSDSVLTEEEKRVYLKLKKERKRERRKLRRKLQKIKRKKNKKKSMKLIKAQLQQYKKKEQQQEQEREKQKIEEQARFKRAEKEYKDSIIERLRQKHLLKEQERQQERQQDKELVSYTEKVKQRLKEAMRERVRELQKKLQTLKDALKKLEDNKPQTEQLLMSPTLLWVCNNTFPINADYKYIDMLKKDNKDNYNYPFKVGDWTQQSMWTIFNTLLAFLIPQCSVGKLKKIWGRMPIQNPFGPKGWTSGNRLNTFEKFVPDSFKKVLTDKAKRSGIFGLQSDNKYDRRQKKITEQITATAMGDICGWAQVLIELLFFKSHHDCNPTDSIELFFKCKKLVFHNISEAERFYGRITDDNAFETQTLLEGDQYKYKAPSKNTDGALLRRKHLRKRLDKLPPVDHHMLNNALGVTDQTEFNDFIRGSGDTYSVQEMFRYMIRSIQNVSSGSVLYKLKYWIVGNMGNNEKSQTAIGSLIDFVNQHLKWNNQQTSKEKEKGEVYCLHGCVAPLGERLGLGLWVCELNINLTGYYSEVNQFGNYLYDHFGCLFYIDIDGKHQYQPYYRNKGNKEFILGLESPVPAIRNMYSLMKRHGFKGQLSVESPILRTDAMMRAYIGAFETWKQDYNLIKDQIAKLEETIGAIKKKL